MTSRPASYRVQPACANCAHCESATDLPIEWHCALGTTEKFPGRYDRFRKVWGPREVVSYGVCDHHSPAERASQPGTRIDAPRSSPPPNDPK